MHSQKLKTIKSHKPQMIKLENFVWNNIWGFFSRLLLLLLHEHVSVSVRYIVHSFVVFLVSNSLLFIFTRIHAPNRLSFS